LTGVMRIYTIHIAGSIMKTAVPSNKLLVYYQAIPDGIAGMT
jgi:hypothetical protein